MSNEITSELLIQYLDNELDAAQHASVEAALAADADLRQLLERLRIAKHAVRQYARRDAVTTILKDEMKQPARVVKMSWLRNTMRIAALLLVLLVIAGLIQYSLLDADRLYAAQYKEFSLATLRGDDSSTVERNGSHFFAGLDYLKANHPEKAVAAFEKQLSVNEKLALKPYQEDAEYYLGLAYLKANNANTALSIFEKIKQQPQHAYNKEVSAWFLTKLRWLAGKQS